MNHPNVMSLKTWHPGKIILLWAVVGGALLYSRWLDLDDLTGIAGLGAIVVSFLTWQWLSARERPLQPATASAKRPRTIEDAADDLCTVVVGATSDEQGAVRGLLEQVAVDGRQLGRELVALKRFAAYMAVERVLANSPKQCMQLRRVTDARILKAMGETVSLAELDQRRDEYDAAMNIFADNEALSHVTPGAETLRYVRDPTTNVGKLFAYICGAEDDPIVAATGTTMFVLTDKAVKDVLMPG